MRAYVDECGDSGFHAGRSSPFLVIATMLVENVTACEDALNRFRRQQRWPEHQELKFERSSDKVRREVLRVIKSLHLELPCLVIEKARIRIPYKEIKPGLYELAVRLSLGYALCERYADYVIIDEVGQHRGPKQRFITYLRTELNNPVPILGEISIRASNHEAGLQVADMVAGAVAYKYKRDNDSYSGIITGTLTEYHWP